jgi:hypothetical protein
MVTSEKALRDVEASNDNSSKCGTDLRFLNITDPVKKKPHFFSKMGL